MGNDSSSDGGNSSSNDSNNNENSSSNSSFTYDSQNGGFTYNGSSGNDSNNSSSNDNNSSSNDNRCLANKFGGICTQNEVLHATSAWNSVNDDSVGWGSRVSGVISAQSGDVNYQCTADNITGPASCKK